MAKSTGATTKSKSAKATSPEEQESRCISLAMNEAEKQLREGTASSQVITHFLKMGTARERAELEKLSLEKELLKAKTKAYESSEEIKQLYLEATEAMKRYSGNA